MDAYIKDNGRVIEVEVPPGVPALPLARNGLASPKEEVAETSKNKGKAAKHAAAKAGENAKGKAKEPSPEKDTKDSASSSSTGTPKPGSAGTTGSSTVDSTDCAIPTQYVHPKRSLKKMQKTKKDKEREIANLLKSWNNLSIEEKFNNLTEKYTELHEDTRKMQMKLYLTEKEIAILVKEKGQWQAEQNKLVMQRSRLEGVCRELQKQNKQIKVLFCLSVYSVQNIAAKSVDCKEMLIRKIMKLTRKITW